MITRRETIAGALALPLAACGKKRGRAFYGHAFVALAESRAVAVIDLFSFTVKERVKLDAAPVALAASPNGDAVFALAPAAKAVVELDRRRYTLRRRAALPGTPAAMKLAHDARALWFALEGAPQLAGVAMDDFRVTSNIALPAAPLNFDLNREAPLACAALQDGSVAVADLTTGKLRGRVHVSAGIGAAIFRSDGKQILVADRAEGQLLVLDTATLGTVVRLPLSLRPDHLCVKADGGQLFITGAGRDAVVIAFPYRTEIAQTALSGRAPGAMAVSARPDYLFVANPTAGSVTIFDIDTQKVLAVTGVGSEPCHISVTPDQQYALVLNRQSGDMAVILIAQIQAGRAKSAPLLTMIPVGSQPVDAVVLAA